MPVWYFPGAGFVLAFGYVGLSLLPRVLVLPLWAVGLVLLYLIDHVARRGLSSQRFPRLGRRGIAYVIFLAVISVGVIALDIFAAQRTETDWLVWVLGLVVFGAVASGSWFLRRRPAAAGA